MTSPNLPPSSDPGLDGWLKSGPFQNWLLGLLLVLAVILVYQPVWHAGFIWDDDVYVTNNPLLFAPDGLRRIWFSLDSPSQYFPLTYTAFRLEYALWDLNPAGYHWVNILLHAGNTLLVWWLLRRLAVPGAWLTAALWALHPVQVETVAWITELKNVLMCFFYLLTLHTWISFVGETRRRSWSGYVLALVLYALALAAKTTACTLPAALLLILWWQHQPITRARVAQVIPFLALGLGMGLVTVWWERFHQGTQGPQFAMGMTERMLVASHALWFYAGKLVWPVNLTFSYPRWTINPANPLAYGWLLAGAAGAGIVYYFRRMAGRGPEVALLFFALTLSPLLGFIMLYTFRYTFVADHYQYVASLGLIALASAGLTTTLNLLKQRLTWLKPVFCGGLLTLLGILTWQQCGMYANIETLWRTTIVRNPSSWLAHLDLAALLVQKERLPEAIVQYQATLKINPNYAPAYYGLGIALSQAGSLDAAIANYEQALQINPDYADAHNNLGNALFQKGNVDGAIVQYQEALKMNPRKAEARNNLGTALVLKGRVDEAIADFREALRIDPQDAEAYNNLGSIFLHQGREGEAAAQYQAALKIRANYPQAQNNLAWVLATARQATLRNGRAAVELAQQANRLTGNGNPTFLRTLAAAYAEAGRFPEAVATAQQAGTLAEAQSNTTLAGTLRSDMKRYQARLSFPKN